MNKVRQGSTLTFSLSTKKVLFDVDTYGFCIKVFLCKSLKVLVDNVAPSKVGMEKV